MVWAVCWCAVLPSLAHADFHGRLWVEWQGARYAHWRGGLRLTAGQVLRTRCRHRLGEPGVLRRHDDRSVRWDSDGEYEGGTCHSVIIDLRAPEDAGVTVSLPGGDRKLSLASLQRHEFQSFDADGYLSLVFRQLYPRRRTERIDKLKPLYRDTVLVEGGKPQAVIITGRSSDEQSQRIVETIHKLTGAQLPILTAESVTDADYRFTQPLPQTKNLILVGDIDTNRAMVRLYAQGRLLVDAQFPGDGGYWLKTLCDPWGTGRNALVVGAGDTGGLRLAVDELVSLPPFQRAGASLRLPPLTRLRYGKRDSVLPAGLVSSIYYPDQYDLLGRRGIPLQPGSPVERNNLFNFMTRLGLLGKHYNITGDERIPRHVKEKLDELGLVRFLHDYWSRFTAWRDADPVRFHLFARGMAVGWDLLEEAPAFTDADRWAVTNVLWNIMNGAATRRNKFWQQSEPTELQSGILLFHSPNHETWSGLALYQMASYFKKYYPDLDESDYWLELARDEFAGHESTFETIEDAKLFQARDTRSCLAYALASGNMGYLRRGIAKTMADFEAVVTDNLGFGSGFGDGGLTVAGVPTDVLTQAEFYYRTGEYQWLARHLIRSPTKVPLMACRVPEQRPDRLLGLCVVPAYQWPHTDSVHYRAEEWVDYPRAERGGYNKVSFREDFRRDAQYLLMDGRRKLAYHNQDDANSIVRFTDNGRMWIVDDHPSMRGVQDQNGVSYDCDGRGASLGADADLAVAADLDRLSLVESVVPVFGPALWQRFVVWCKGLFFIIVDRLQAQRAGDYLVRCHWRLRGQPQYESDAVTLEQQGERFRLQCGSPARLWHERLDMKDIWGRNEAAWYPYAEPVCHVLHEDRTEKLAADESVSFANVFYAFNDAEPLDVRLALAGDHTWLVTRRKGATVEYARLDAGAQTAGGGLQTDARISWVATGHCAFGGVTRVALGGEQWLTADHPLSLAVDCERRQGLAVTTEPTTIHLRGMVGLAAEGKSSSDGVLRLPTGRSRFRFDAARGLQANLSAILTNCRQQAHAPATSQQKLTAKERLPVVSVWQRETKAEVRFTGVTDMDGDGAEDLLLGCADGHALAIRLRDGAPVWEYRAPAPVNHLLAADVDGDGRREVIVCAGDAACLGLDGKVRWRFAVQPPEGSSSHTCHGAAVAKMKQAGRCVLVAGARLNVLSPDGKLLWFQPPEGIPLPGKWMPHEFITAGDVDGDGFDEAIGGVQMSYPFVYAIDGEKRLVFDYPARAGDWRRGRRPLAGRVTLVRCLDIDGDGRAEALSAGVSGGIRVNELEGGKWVEWMLPMISRPTCLAVIPARSDQSGWVLAGDASLFLYLFRIGPGPSGKLVWRRRLPEPATAAAVWSQAGETRFIIAGESGTLLLVGGDRGDMLLQPAAPANVRALSVHREKGVRRLLVVTSHGSAEMLQPRESES